MPRTKKTQQTTTNEIPKRRTRKTKTETAEKPVKVEKGAVKYTLIIPAGKCPIKLTSTTRKVVQQWCKEMVSHLTGLGVYTKIEKSAYKYYAREFYFPNTEEYKKVCRYIDEVIPDTEGGVNV
jgi:hypothetical protein